MTGPRSSHRPKVRETGELFTALAALRLAQDDPEAAAVALAPVLDRSTLVAIPRCLVQAFLLLSIAGRARRDARRRARWRSPSPTACSTGTAARVAQRQREVHPALPTDPSVHTRDRALPVGAHRPLEADGEREQRGSRLGRVTKRGQCLGLDHAAPAAAAWWASGVVRKAQWARVKWAARAPRRGSARDGMCPHRPHR
jgi:hypothetical protein